METQSIDPKLLSGHSLAVKLYRDLPEFAEAQPLLEATMDVVAQEVSSSERMTGSRADWHAGSAQVRLLRHLSE